MLVSDIYGPDSSSIGLPRNTLSYIATLMAASLGNISEKTL